MILDTNALSAVADDHPGAVELYLRSPGIEIPVNVLGEFRYGMLRSRLRAQYERWLDGLQAASRVLPVDEDTAVHYAHIRLELRGKGRPLPVNDVWIAALARQHDLPVMSRDRHFDSVTGVQRVDW